MESETTITHSSLRWNRFKSKFDQFTYDKQEIYNIILSYDKQEIYNMILSYDKQ